jgi:hypothetical protein
MYFRTVSTLFYIRVCPDAKTKSYFRLRAFCQTAAKIASNLLEKCAYTLCTTKQLAKTALFCATSTNFEKMRFLC